MSNTTFSRLRDYVEPAHPSVIRLQDDLINVYTLLRENYQRRIDEAFNEIARNTGFVITTTLPIVLTVDKKGARLEMGTENLRGTLFESAMMEVLRPMGDELAEKLPPGEYPLYLIWYDALKLKLRTDWMEPAHWRRFEPFLGTKVEPGWGVREPAHWFDPRLEIDLRDALVINALDQVYPELKLLERVEAARGAVMRAEVAREIGPGIREPAHFRQFLQDLDPRVLDQLVAALQEFQRRR